MDNESNEGKEEDQNEMPAAPAAVEKRQRVRRKKGKMDEVLTSLSRIVDFLGDTDFHRVLAREITQEIRVLAEISKSSVLKLANLDKLGDSLSNLYGCSFHTNWHVVASHAELVRLNESLTTLNQTVKSLQVSRPLEVNQSSDFNRPLSPPGYPGAPMTPQAMGWQPSLPICAPAPPNPFGPPQPPQPAQPAPQPVQPPPPPETILSMLIDLSPAEVFKIGREFNLFTAHGAEDEFMKTNTLRQAQIVSEKVQNLPTARSVIKERVDAYRGFLTGGYKNRKLGP